MIRLNEIKDSEEAIIMEINNDEKLLRSLSSMGIVEGSKIKKLKSSPLNDPCLYLVRGMWVAIRNRDARLIGVERL